MKRNRFLLLTIMLMVAPFSLFAAEETPLTGVEQQAMADTFQYALENNPTSQTSDWVNPDTQRSGTVVPVKTFENAQGQPCREFVTTIIIADKEEQGYGTACRQPDGSWELVSSDDQSNSAPPVPQTAPTNYQPPTDYYVYPRGFYGSSTIYLSFNTVYRSGRLHRGRYYSRAADFRYRYMPRVRSRVYYGPRLYERHRIYDELKYRDWDRKQWPRKKIRKDWKHDRRERYEDRRERRHDRYDDGHKGRRGKKYDD